MSSYDTWHNLLSGISQGSFDKIYVRDASGQMVDLLTLISSGHTGFVTNVALTTALAAYTDTTALNALLAAYTRSLRSY